ncbi:NAD(P)-dependent oxidoreductase [Streptomyces sp. NBC_00620]|uniref:NAD(P)-dependent oxidoreductase n=1 Tax=Streptomyces sp. NBC_00620 TaxID=2903666 RepID=UPI00225304D9|nr:NAD(P)-dependent oxidoreductase [Streptomyces sp. NBC_00620]MCX4978468.1 NAD(P)-dependent oxidoreductase [Streptomyces sp. NBC_00620]
MTTPTDRTKPRIGWLGTGRMGSAMVQRLLAAGYEVAVHNRTRAKAESLREYGATVAGSVAELAHRDVVFIMVAADAALTEVTVAEGGLLRQTAAPGILVDCSTVSQKVALQIRAEAAKAGAPMLAAPVSGNPSAVRAGTAAFVVSGPPQAYEIVNPLLTAIAGAAAYVGEGEEARLVKIAHNLFLGAVIQSLAEITVLAEKGGVRRSDFLAFINVSVLGSVFTRYKTPALTRLDFTPTFTPQLLRKDFELGLSAARESGVSMPVAALVHQLVQASVQAQGQDGPVDFAVLLAEVARASGLLLEAEEQDAGEADAEETGE